MDPFAVEDGGEEFDLVEDVGCEIFVEIFVGGFVTDKFFGPDEHASFNMIVEDGVLGRRGIEIGNVLFCKVFAGWSDYDFIGEMGIAEINVVCSPCETHIRQ